MAVQSMLKELVKKRGLRRVANDLGIDHASLYRSLNSDLRLSTIEAIANLFDYDLKLVKKGKDVELVFTQKEGRLNGGNRRNFKRKHRRNYKMLFE
jgi:hypothetical protein